VISGTEYSGETSSVHFYMIPLVLCIFLQLLSFRLLNGDWIGLKKDLLKAVIFLQ